MGAIEFSIAWKKKRLTVEKVFEIITAYPMKHFNNLNRVFVIFAIPTKSYYEIVPNVF